MKDTSSDYKRFKTKRLYSLLKQVTKLNSNLSFEDNDYVARIRYTIPEQFRDKQWPLESYMVLDYCAKKPRDRYVGLFKKIFREVELSPFDSDVELKFSCLEEYMLKLAICGGK